MRRLPLYIRPDLRFSCHSCSDCCRSYVVTVDAEDEQKLRAQRWWRRGLRFLGGVVTAGLDQWGAPARVLRRRADGRCIFLDNDKLCRIHKEHGHAAKPRVCRQFPFIFVKAPDGLRAAMTGECTTRHRSLVGGALVTESRPELEALAEAATPYESRFRVRLSDPGPLISTRAYVELEQRARDAMAAGPLLERLVALARTVSLPTIEAPSPVGQASRMSSSTVDEVLAPLLPIIEEETDDPGREPLAAAARALSAPGAWRRALARCDEQEPASAFLQAVVFGWLDEAVPARTPTAADGVGRMLLRTLLCAAPALALKNAATAADAADRDACLREERTAAAMNVVARVISMAFRGERGAELQGRLGGAAPLQRAFANMRPVRTDAAAE